MRKYDFEGPDMVRSNVTYLIIATVLICPYRCLGDDTAAVDVPPQAICCCCDEPLAPGSKNPDTPEGGDQDCFCRGAIEGAKVDRPELGTGQLWHLRPQAGSLFPGMDCASIDARHPVHFPPQCTGREICALVNARLL